MLKNCYFEKPKICAHENLYAKTDKKTYLLG